MCACVCAIAENPLPGGLETSGWREYRFYWHTSRRFWVFCGFLDLLRFEIFFFGEGDFENHLTGHNGVEWQGERMWLWLLALVTVDRWHATCDTWHSTHDAWHMTPDKSQLTNDFFCLFFPYLSIYRCVFLTVLVSVLLSAHVERFNVSRMRDLLVWKQWTRPSKSSRRNQVQGLSVIINRPGVAGAVYKHLCHWLIN